MDEIPGSDNAENETNFYKSDQSARNVNYDDIEKNGEETSYPEDEEDSRNDDFNEPVGVFENELLSNLDCNLEMLPAIVNGR